jgi:uncharacterized protein (DUF362 family)
MSNMSNLSNMSNGLRRRPLLGVLPGGVAGLAATVRPRPAGAAPYRVGVGKSSDAYTATRRAIEASGEWPAATIAGRVVVIKPNLVGPATADTGMVTDPEAVRALVDLALQAGASRVLIVEGGRQQANFTPCGYDFFRTYDPAGRVALVDLTQAPVVLAPVPGGLAYRYVYLPRFLLDPNLVLVSAGKLKTHAETMATMGVKNLFGLPPVPPYFMPDEPFFRPRFHLHERGVHQTIVDLTLLRPSHFTIVDGVWGMEGEGPTDGTPVRMDLVVAGQNAVAVDRVCLYAMGMAQEWVQYLAYAAAKGLGPATLSGIEVRGDPFTPRPFRLPAIVSPIVWRPVATPNVIAPGLGQQTLLAYRLHARPDLACATRVEIVRTSEQTSTITLVRTIRDWAPRASGVESLPWDGRDDAGQIVSPGVYTARVQARYDGHDEVPIAYATCWVTVTA